MPLVLEPDWVGRRVAVRRALETADGPRFADSVGDLVSLTSDAAVVQTRAGVARIRVESVVAARVAEPSAGDILALEAVCARGWQAEHTDERGGWLLRANEGFTSRANTALPLGQPVASLNDTLDAARAWYAARGLPLGVQIPLPARRLLDGDVAARGWTASPDVLVLAARLDMLRAVPDGPSDVHIAATPDDAWVARYRDGRVPAVAREILVRHERAGFAELRRDGRTVAIGRGTVDEGWLGVTAVEVDPAWRRQGLAVSIMTALCEWARDVHGATRSYLQVTADNHAAMALYRRLGYWQHHTYRYRTEPIG